MMLIHAKTRFFLDYAGTGLQYIWISVNLIPSTFYLFSKTSTRFQLKKIAMGARMISMDNIHG